MTDPLDDAPVTRWQTVGRWAYGHRHALVLFWMALLWWATFYRLGALRHERVADNARALGPFVIGHPHAQPDLGTRRVQQTRVVPDDREGQCHWERVGDSGLPRPPSDR